MEAKNIVKKYTKDELTILWEPKKCIHAAICVKELPKVYDPKAKPWIKPENASVAELKAQIDKCPSGALSYEKNETSNQDKHMKTENVVIGKYLNQEIWKNGPKNPPAKVSVKVVKEEDKVRVELVGAPEEPVKEEEPKNVQQT